MLVLLFIQIFLQKLLVYTEVSGCLLKNLIIFKKNELKVKFSIFLEYAKSCHPLLFSLFTSLYILVQVTSACSTFWLNDWVSDSKVTSKNTEDTKMHRLYIYILIGSTQCFISLLGETVHTLMFIRAVKYLHNSMLFSILRSNMRFFESTPSGRIINRFNKDIEANETSIPNTLKDVFYCLFIAF